ncbi:Putative secreted protein [Corynebacterium glyciniphilum AJ 3170]|uniref:Putative secreted protein n=1 Tax=Corynebacterium glyciniphilum AJ 3170 TaxID=1404245 RepID=X5DSS8_9CORY|nr:hypothetical protein [Corynebacterium glyciniphilum]AHW63727.1 Putative secreted protein [Corynebacterium glyciniphilum AJ 3170]
MTVRRTATVALILAVPLALSACTTNDETADTNQTTAPANSTTTEATEASEDEARIGQPLTVAGAEITPTNLRPAEQSEQKHTCVDINIKVASDAEPLDIHGLAAWKLYDPSNTARLQTANDDTQHLPNVVEPGQEAQGTVCFDNAPGTPGDYELRFRGNIDPLTNEAVWTGKL